jgi:hypothetical protein
MRTFIPRIASKEFREITSIRKGDCFALVVQAIQQSFDMTG